MKDLDRIKKMAKYKNISKGIDSETVDILESLFGQFDGILAKQSQDKIASLGKKFEKIIEDQKKLMEQLAGIIASEPPVVHVAAAEVKIPKSPDIKFPEQKAPVVNVNAGDNTKEIKAMTESVNKLKEVMENKPKKTKWEVTRNNQGFINTIEATD